ncbi:MAG: (Fe-S)-binding protein [Eubacteriaceae bacterium]
MKFDRKDLEGLDLYEIYSYLPNINCKRCGENTCLAFAQKVESGTKQIDQCVVICERKSEKH